MFLLLPANPKMCNFSSISGQFKVFVLCIAVTVMAFVVCEYTREHYTTSKPKLKNWGGIVIPYTPSFQYIGNGSRRTTIFSAYYDDLIVAGHPSILVIAGLLVNWSEPLYCVLYDKNKNKLPINSKISNLAKVRPLKYDMWFNPFKHMACYVICNISDVYPSYVSIVENEITEANKNEKIPNLMSIHYNIKTHRKLNFAVCMKALHSYERPLRMAEWIEFHKLMGVEKITVYNEDIGPQTLCLMNSYGNFVEVLPWETLYKRNVSDMLIGGQIITLHDCLQRYKGIANYVIYVDVDEMIVPFPEAGNNYFEMIAFLNRNAVARNVSLDSIAGYSFRHGEFLLQMENPNLSFLTVEDNPIAENILRKLIMSRAVWRVNFTDHQTYRSKLIVLPHKIVEAAVHIIPESANNTITEEIPDNVAYLHHYRDGCKDGGCNNTGRILEDSAVKFAKSVAIEIADTWKEKAKLCDISIDNY